MVVSARLGNKFITSASTGERPYIYIYLVDDDHFHAITRIRGFFSAISFCEKCFKQYDHRERPECDTSCIVCKRDKCLKQKLQSPVQIATWNADLKNVTKSIKRYLCTRKVKANASPLAHLGVKMVERPTCYKVLRTDKRKKEEHECGENFWTSCEKYVMDDRLCYFRTRPAKKDFILKSIISI